MKSYNDQVKKKYMKKNEHIVKSSAPSIQTYINMHHTVVPSYIFYSFTHEISIYFLTETTPPSQFPWSVVKTVFHLLSFSPPYQVRFS